MSGALGSTASCCEHCGQPLPKGERWKSRNFRRGLLVVFPTLIPFVFGAVNALRSISATKATGMGAVAGGISEIGVTFGLLALIIFAAGGILFFVRGFVPGKRIRAVLSVLGIAWCGFVLVSTTLTIAFLVYFTRQRP